MEFQRNDENAGMRVNPTALIIDGERAVRRLVRVVLEQEHYKVIGAETGRMGLEVAVEQQPDVIILELDLPDINGLVVLRHIREWSQKPVLILSERGGSADKVTAFDAGADDYLTKPFDNAELLARLQVARRHAQPAAGETLFRSGPLTVDLASRSVTVNGKPVKLTGTEYALLRLFVRNAGKVLTHPQIMEVVWGPGNRSKTHYLHVYMTYLRGKIEAVPARPELLLTEARVGYRLIIESPARPGAERAPAKDAMNRTLSGHYAWPA
jgi:two-component system KDP operon response regulator KdpE